MKSWDTIVIGAGIIGLSVALEMRKRGMSALVVEKGEPGREASWAAGGMLADFPMEMPAALCNLAEASARMYPEFVVELESESGIEIDLRAVGTLFFAPEEHRDLQASYPMPRPLSDLEPEFRTPSHAPVSLHLKERSVDPRQLAQALLAAAKRRGVEFASGEPVLTVEIKNDRADGVRTAQRSLAAKVIVNCAGAWAGQVSPIAFPTRPVKGQMLSVAMPQKEFIGHVVRTPDIYLIPRSDGRLVIGATSEEAGFDKQMVPGTIAKLRQATVDVVPQLADAPVLETWAGLRPATPDRLPILGATSLPGYFVATGHFRDGILLAPVTARVMGQVMTGQDPDFDLNAFSPQRFFSSS